jgi:hypothetical protein
VISFFIGVCHHIDHVLRYDHSGWPFRPEVTPFTYSFLVYPVFLAAALSRRYPVLRLLQRRSCLDSPRFLIFISRHHSTNIGRGQKVVHCPCTASSIHC